MTESCQLCGGADHITISRKDRHGGDLVTVLCMNCGVVTNDPIPTDEELAAFYRSAYRKEYKGTAEPRMRQVWRNFSRLAAHVSAYRDIYDRREKCLDLGAGSGEFMFLAKALGIACTGIEPNEDYSAYCRDRLDLDVRTQTLEETKFAPGSFDLIRLSHVLEHMRDPVRSLKVLHRWLAKDGVLYIEVPDIAVEADRKVRGRLFHFGHIFNFNPYTLRLAAGLAGFEVLPEAEKRGAGRTGVFFHKSAGRFAMPAGGTKNAAGMKASMDSHFARAMPRPATGSALGRFVSVNRLRLREMLAAKRFASHRAIADHFATVVRAGGDRP